MPFTNFYQPTLVSYGLAAAIFAAFAARLVLRWRGGLRAWVVLGAAVASALWCLSTTAALVTLAPLAWTLSRGLDAVRLAAWLAFVAILLEGGAVPRLRGPRRNVGVTLALLCALLAVGAGLPLAAPWGPQGAGASVLAAMGIQIAVAVFGLALTEQLYRSMPETGRWAIKPLVIGVGGMFCFDVLMYSGAMLFRQLDPAIWVARGMAHALVVFFVMLATARNAGWTMEMHVSRGVVLHSTAFLASGAYLLVVALAAYWVRLVGEGWGGTLQVAVVFASLLGLAALALSGTLRSWLRVFISKHFFAYRYDYRREWLRFTDVLGSATSRQALHEKAIQALADLVESLGGALWLERSGGFRQIARLNLPEVGQTEPIGSSLAAFLHRTGWVIRLEELARHPERYGALTLPAWLAGMKGAWLVVPLLGGEELIGFVVLARPRAPVDVNWEVLDLLKTAGRQAAAFIAQLQTSEALLEAEKFDAFNRMSTFLVHDLKNLVAQLALLLKNAERHRDNPEFQADMLATIDHVVERMNRLMRQLSASTQPLDKPRPLDLSEAVRAAIRPLAGRGKLGVQLAPGLRAHAHGERIERVIGHIVQNALEAAEASAGEVRVRTFEDAGEAVVEVTDNGAGMSEEFIRERLFRPFQTTKARGLGIGMNESLQYVNQIGGRIAVESSPGAGSRFRVSLPLAEPARQAGQPLEEGA